MEIEHGTTQGVSYHIENAGNFNKVCEKMVHYVKEHDLKKEQIISISTNESGVEEGEAILILFFREEKDSTMTPLDNLQFAIERNVDDWDI